MAALPSVGMTDRTLTIRVAAPDDAGTLRRLAELDSARSLRGRVLIAEAGGVPVAAVALETGAVTADPFRRTAGAVHALRQRRYELLRQSADAPAARLPRRLAPAPA
jgi:hypothetical protein